MSLKREIASVTHWMAWAGGFSARLARRQPVRRILMYHGVGGAEYSKETFRAGLEYLRAGFNIVPLDVIVQKIRAGEPCRNEVALTFDDGLRNNFTVAYPVLREFGLPAVFFVCPGLVDSGRWVWTHECRERVSSLEDSERDRLCADLGISKNSAGGVVGWMKSLDTGRRAAAEEIICKRTSDFQPTAAQREKYDLMDWGEISRLDPALITIGSHSETHPVLATLNPAQTVQEVAGSRVRLEKQLNRKVCLFCYPNGDYNQTVLDAVRQNYEAAVTTEFRSATAKEDLHLLPQNFGGGIGTAFVMETASADSINEN